MGEALVGDVRISYAEEGQGEPALLMLPPWCGSRQLFSAVASSLCQRRRVIALDWRGHGKSGSAGGEYGHNELLQDAMAVIAASGAQRLVVVAQSQAGWIALMLRQHLGERIAKLVLLDWLVLEPPRVFLQALFGLQTPERYKYARDNLFNGWLENVRHPHVIAYVQKDMANFGPRSWSYAGREISSAYEHHGSPLRLLATLSPPVPTLHLFSQPRDPDFLTGQRAFAASHPWYHVARLDYKSPFLALESPDSVVKNVEYFLSAG